MPRSPHFGHDVKVWQFAQLEEILDFGREALKVVPEIRSPLSVHCRTRTIAA